RGGAGKEPGPGNSRGVPARRRPRGGAGAIDKPRGSRAETDAPSVGAPSLKARVLPARASGFAALCLWASWAAPVAAQVDPFGGGMGAGQQQAPTQQKPKAPPPGTPELHAASGGGDSTLPEGSEPTLPEAPLAISEALRARLGSDLK